MARDAVTGFLTASTTWQHGNSYVTTTPRRKVVEPRLVDEVYADAPPALLDELLDERADGDVAPTFTDMYDVGDE